MYWVAERRPSVEDSMTGRYKRMSAYIDFISIGGNIMKKKA